MRATCFFISLSKEQLRVVFVLFVRNLHFNTHTIMSTKLMDATPDLKRLAPVENLAIDVISYAHGSVTPTLTNLYTKGKDSFLKVSKSSSSSRWCLSLSLSSSLILLRLQIECNGFDHLDAASICVYCGSRLLLLLLLREAASARLLRILFLVCEKRTRRRERTVVASSLSSRRRNKKKILTIMNRNNFTFVNARAIF